LAVRRLRRSRDALHVLEGGEVECRILAKDLLVKLAERPARLDTELVHEGAARGLVCLERFCLASGAVEREHQLGPELFSERMLADKSIELADELSMASFDKVMLDPLLDARESELLQASDLGMCKALLGEISQRFAAPQRERSVRPPALVETLEAREVELVRGEAEQVSAWSSLQPLSSELLPQLGDVHLEGLARGLGRFAFPERFDEPVSADDTVCVDRQQGQQGTLLGAAKVDRPTAFDDLEWAEDAEFHGDSCGDASTVRARVQVNRGFTRV